jgi:hypothetical protein
VCRRFFFSTAAGELEQRFLNPPEDAKPWVYWFWMNGNISEEGITADLEAMDRIGVGGVLIMNVGLRTPPGPYDFNTPEWRALYSHAAKECVRLGMQMTLHPLDGWATSGGQWMPPEQSMKMLVWETKEVEGATGGPVRIEQPFTKENFYEDVAVLAFPAPQDDLLQPDRIVVNGKPDGVLFDGNLGTGVSGAIDMLAEFDEPVDLSTVVFPREKAWPYHLQAVARTLTTIEVSADGTRFEPVSEFDFNVAIDNGDHFSLTVSFPTRAAKAVRIRMDNKRSNVQIPEIELRSEPRVDLWEVKSSLARERNHGGETFIIDAAPRPGAIEGVDPSQVIDLTDRIAADGTLDWNVPPRRWRIVRAGMTSTGKHTAPATHAGSGLEADKMNKEAIRHHWSSFGKGMVEENNISAGNPIWSVHTDSWESQVHTWGTGFQKEFEKRRGYSMTPWMPVLTIGAIIGSAEESERFLWDYRRTAADLIAENYYGEMKRQANESGLLFQSEAAGRQMFMYDPLNYAAQTDIYVGEFWMVGNVRADCKIASSAANTYGRPFAAAEAWTSGNGGLRDAPFDWKPLGDHAFTVGINRVIIHRYAMQPFNNVEPGMTFGPYGINFERTQTFWENGGKAWVSYLTRCQSLLQTGTFVADVIHYIGHDAPNYLGHRDELWNPVPPGYDFDGCNLEILQRLQVEADGMLALPSGMRYRVLLLPNREHMTLEAIREVERLVQAGAVVVGPKPLRTPGLHNHVRNDAELAAIAGRVWGNVDGQSVTENRYVSGRVIYGLSLESVLEAMVPPDFDYSAPANALVRYIHRKTDEGDVYFVANGNKEMAFDAVLRFRVTDRHPELWDPSTGAIRKVDAWRVVNGVTELPVHFDPAGSWFVVFREAAQPPSGLDANLFDPAGSSPSIETNAFKNFTMAFWLKSSAPLDIPPPGTPGVPVAGQNYAVYPAPGHEVWGGTDAGVGISAGKDGLIVIAHGTRYFASPLIHGVDLSEWTHVAVTAQDNAMTLYVNGESVAQATAPGRTLHASIGVEHTRGVAAFKGQAEAFFQSSETLHADAIRALMRRTAQEGAVDTGIELSGPWIVSFPPGRQAPEQIELPELISWTEHPDDGVKYFSGTATYRKAFSLSMVDGCWLMVAGEHPLQLSNSTTQQLFLDLGEVKEIAEVKLNGTSLGILWKPPFKVDITGALVAGENTLEVKVTNLWPNRLIGDEKLHPDPSLDYMQIGGIWGVGPHRTIPQWVRDGGSSPVGRTTWILNKFYSADSPLLPSGLLGPVRLTTQQEVPVKCSRLRVGE